MINSLKILMVDDDPDDYFLFCEAIRKIDATIVCDSVNDGIDAMAYLSTATHIPDFIFLDLNMPRMNGKEFLKKFCLSPFKDKIPVVIYSTSRMSSDVEETRLLGAAAFIKKPYDFDDMCKEISAVLTKLLTARTENVAGE